MKISDLPAKIAVRIKIDPISGCWVWTGPQGGPGYKEGKGYGQLVTPSGKHQSVHRYVYEFFHGPIPPGLELDHVRDRGCIYRICCWPEHLEPVTHAENVRRAGLVGVAVGWSERTHCDRGHKFTPENTYERTDGGRRCRICITELGLDKGRIARDRKISVFAVHPVHEEVNMKTDFKIEAGAFVHSRDGKHVGVTTGTTRTCQLAGCTGLNVHVRWPSVENKLTMPCTKGMEYDESTNEWTIV